MVMELVKKYGFRVGLAIVVGSHIYMALYGLPESQMMWHWVSNIFAGVLIYFGDKTPLF